jgi:hypothetical protein
MTFSSGNKIGSAASSQFYFKENFVWLGFIRSYKHNRIQISKFKRQNVAVREEKKNNNNLS